MIKTKSGRGSVGRSIRRQRFKEEQPEEHQAWLKQEKILKIIRKEKTNKRCLDCDVLIFPESTRCGSCARKKIMNLSEEQ